MQRRHVTRDRANRLWRLALASCLLLSVLFSTTPAAEAQPLVLVRDGAPGATIVVARTVEINPDAVRIGNGIANGKTVNSLDAARELQEYVQRSTGVELPIVFEDQDVSGPLVLVGESRYTRELGLSSAGFERQEYLIRATPEVLILMGRDETLEEFFRDVGNAPNVHHGPHPLETFEAVGTQYAVQDFLEKYVGVRWYFMGELGEVVPEHDEIVVEPMEVRRKPDTKHRSLYISGIPPNYYWEPTLGRGPGYTTTPEEAAYLDTRRVEASVWGRHLKMGGEPMALNHSFHIPFAWGILTVDENTYPGKPNANTSWVDWPALTNQQVIDGFVETARRYFNGQLENLPPFTASGDFFAVIPHDTEDTWGSDPETLRWIKSKAEADRDVNAFRSRTSNYYWPFVAKVAGEVQETHPDKYITALAYRMYSYPPDPSLVKRFPDNVAVGLCLGMATWDRRPTREDPFTEEWIIRQWVKVANPELMFQWRYMLWPTNPHYRNFPDVNPVAIGRMVRNMKKFGMRGGVFMQIDEAHGTFWSYPVLDHLRVYVAAKMLDDWTLNENDIVDEYYTQFYGPAEEPMRRFWEYMHNASYEFDTTHAGEFYTRWVKQHPGSTQELWDWTVKCPPHHLKAMGELFEEGRRLTEPDSIYRQRVELIHDAVYQAYLVRASREVLENVPKGEVEIRPHPFPELNR